MNISGYINEFVRKNHRTKPYSKIYKSVMIGGKPYSMNSQYGYEESENLQVTIKSCVQMYTSTKDTAIELFKDFVSFLRQKGVSVPDIYFPPIPVSNTFERLMFVAKYLQDKENAISSLPDILWISDRQIETDLSRLRGVEDPIQVCGKKFFIPGTERRDGKISFQSTAHPVFLAENLTQVLVMLKGLNEMSKNPLYKPYAEVTANEIWDQLSSYAKNRIRFVLGELMPEEYEWIVHKPEEYHFHTEQEVSRICNKGASVVMDCMKNGKTFCVEYEDEEGTHLYKDCVMIEHSYNNGGITVSCSEGNVRLLFDHVIRSAYTVEELASI